MLARFFSSKAISPLIKKLAEQKTTLEITQKTTRQLCDELGASSISGSVKDDSPIFHKIIKKGVVATKKEIRGNAERMDKSPKEGW